MKKPDLDRRAFCELAGLALVTVVVPACGQPPGNNPPMCGAGRVGAGPPSAVTLNNIVQIDRLGFDSIFVCRDASGVYAMSAACTHNKCTLEFKSAAQGFGCPCHTAIFDFNGEKQTSPAPSPLPHYAICLDTNGNLVVDPDQVVAASVRYKV
jgi:thiosulfate dehydrogenase (quinone) large subunit